MDYLNPISDSDWNDLLPSIDKDTEGIKEIEGVSAVIRNDKGEILLFKHKRLNRWSIPVGHVEPEDQSKEEAIIREMREELGIKIHPKDLNLLGAVQFEWTAEPQNYDNPTQGSNAVFEIQAYQGVPENNESAKHPEMRWFNEEELLSLSEDEISTATQVVIDRLGIQKRL